MPLLILSCKGKKEDSIEKLELKLDSPADSFFVFYDNCRLSEDKILEREKGNKIVFHYYFKNADFADYNDEEYYEEIQFEISPIMLEDSCLSLNVSDIKTKFKWRCFCEYPDSLEEFNNKGFLKIIKKNNLSWMIHLDIENIPLKKSKQINKEFHLYFPEFEMTSNDTINKYDSYRRKQGWWIKEDKGILIQGYYRDNYFTGNMSSSKNVFFFENGRALKIIRLEK